MPQSNLRELAKQGDPKVIAQIINHSLEKKGIKVYVIRKDSSLEVTLESEQLANPKQKKVLVEFIRNGMDKLGVESINTVTVYGVPTGETDPVWEEQIILAEPEEAIEQPIPEVDPLYASEEADTALEIDEDYRTEPPDNFSEDEEELFDEEDELNSEGDFEEDSQADFDEDSQADFDEDSQADFDEDEYEEDEEVASETGKKKLPILAIILPLILLPLVVLAVLHFTGIFPLPFLAGSEPDSSTPNNVESPEVSPSPIEGTSPPAEGEEAPSPEEPPGAETWNNAVRSAINAATKAGEAQTTAEWNEVASEWQRAIDLMREVPESNPNYQTAQQKVEEYQNNLNVAKQRAAGASN